MFIRLSKNSFVRECQENAHLTNQLTHWDRIYNNSGKIFISKIERTPKKIENILGELLKEFYGVSYEELRNDFYDFLEDLESNLFVVTGESEIELDKTDLSFSYSLGNMKIKVKDHTNRKNELRDTLFLLNDPDKPLLNSLQFEITGRCNERCVHCYIPNKSKDLGIDLPTQKIKDTIDEFATLGGLDVTFSGGESLIHSDIIELVRYAREKDMIIGILSNLIALTKDQIDAFREYNVSLVQVSLYSMNPERHDAITGVKGSFARTKKSIEDLVAADIPVQISCPVMKTTKSDYKHVMKYAQSLQVKSQTDS